MFKVICCECEWQVALDLFDKDNDYIVELLPNKMLAGQYSRLFEYVENLKDKVISGFLFMYFCVLEPK